MDADPIVIVGAGIAGLGTALLLGRQGRRVIVLERDSAPVPDDPEEMWTNWPRPGTPHTRLGHGFLPGFCGLLETHAPDVLQRLHEAQVNVYDLAASLPGAAKRLPEDDYLRVVLARRPVLEGLLRQAVEAESTVELRTGSTVSGLVAEPPGRDGIPVVVGVRTRQGTTIAAHTVVLAGGRHLPALEWLSAIGAPPPAEVTEGCGLNTYTRYFRVLPRAGEDYTVTAQLETIKDVGYLVYALGGADRGTFCVEFGIPVEDRELRAVRNETVFMAIAGSFPEIAPWTAPDRSVPISRIAVMGQEQNLLRRFTRSGDPVASRVHVIGDARCRTNSLYARGCGLALTQAFTLADLLLQEDDPLAQALTLEAAVEKEVEGRYRLSLARDRARFRAYRGEQGWDEDAGEDTEDFVQSVVFPATEEDAEVFRAFWRREAQLDPAGALAENTAIQQRARELAAKRQPSKEPAAPLGPTREELLRIIASAAQGAAD